MDLRSMHDGGDFSARPDTVVATTIVIPVLLAVGNVANGKVHLLHL